MTDDTPRLTAALADRSRIAKKINMPGFMHAHSVLAAIYGQLRRDRDAAFEALHFTAAHDFVAETEEWFINREHLTRFAERFRKAELAAAREREDSSRS